MATFIVKFVITTGDSFHSLAMKMIFITFVGRNNDLVAIAKSTVFKEEIPASPSNIVKHDMYFNAKHRGKLLKRVEPADLDDCILLSLSNSYTGPEIIGASEQETPSQESGPSSMSDNLRDNLRLKLDSESTLYHTFEFGSHHQMNEVYKIFIKNVSLCVLVTGSSQGICQEELNILRSNVSYASKGLILEVCDNVGSVSRNREAENNILDEFSHFLVSEAESPMNYIYSSVQIGASILDHALSSSLSTTLPLSWYLFGFRLKQFMKSEGKHVVSVSGEAMVVGHSLGLDRPAAVAALEHLMEHNMLLFFGGVLDDSIFFGVEVFTSIFSALYRKSEKNEVLGTLSQTNFDEATQDVVSNDLLILFSKLMIVAPYNCNGMDYIMPCMLAILNELGRKDQCQGANDTDADPVFFKCPSPGYEFITMLTVFLLGHPSGEWKILQDKQGCPACLFKNCIKFELKGRSIVTISSFKSFIEVYIKSVRKSEQTFNQISSAILRGLEIIKIILNSHQDFDFKMSFPCHCGRTAEVHHATYNSGTGLLTCENDGSVTGKITESKRNDQLKNVFFNCSCIQTRKSLS